MTLYSGYDYTRHVKLKSTGGPHFSGIDYEIHHAGCI